MRLDPARPLELKKPQIWGWGLHRERDLNHGFGALYDISAKKEDEKGMVAHAS
jgi:hypothetical protein